QPEQALFHARKALEFTEELAARSPNNMEFVGNRAIAIAELGASLLAAHLAEGLERLNEALEASQQLARREPGNSASIFDQIIVLSGFVQGLAAWSNEKAASQGSGSPALRGPNFILQKHSG